MRVIGTAGHVDHGKSTLVQALTGINPDRLQEEQDRQMTIDLGFAWLTLPGGEEVGIIDVPGHRDFIDNMLAGVGAIDGALLVIAADEGVMPQTKEHLAILDLLSIERGLIALAKVDLLDDPAWIELVRDDIQSVLRGTSLERSAILPVSAVQRTGLEELVEALQDMLSEAEIRPDRGKPRLLIDRAFTISGFGTVVTGTLIDGSLSAGQEVAILPSGRQARIRSLQTHKTQVDTALAGSRVAANLSGIEVRQIERGDVLALPGSYKPTTLIDVRIRILRDSSSTIRHNQSAKLFMGSAQRMARIRLLGADELRPGEEGWLQLSLSQPIVATRGDRFVLRRASPGATLGGGSLVEAHPTRRHKRKDRRSIDRLEQILGGEPSDVLFQSLVTLGPTSLQQAIDHAGLSVDLGRRAARDLLQGGRLRSLELDGEPESLEQLAIAEEEWQRLRAQAERYLSEFHASFPLRSGMPREQLKSRLGLSSRAFSALVGSFERAEVVRAEASRVRLAEFQISLSSSQQNEVDALLQRFMQAPDAPPSTKECLEAVGEDLLAYLLEIEILIKLSDDVIMHAEAYRDMVAKVRAEMESRGSITVAEVRDLFGTSRKYALALMEHLDFKGLTYRDGDTRRLIGTKRGAPS